MRIAYRLLLQTTAVILVLVASVVLIVDNRLHGRIVAETTAELAREARLVALQWKPGSDADAIADSAGAVTGHRVTLIRSDGVVIGDTDFDTTSMHRLQNHASRPEVIAARRYGVGSYTRVSASTGEPQLYVAVRTPLGFARVSVTTLVVDESFDAARRSVIYAGAVSVLLALLVAFLFSRAVSRPIVELRDVARRLAAGDLTARPALAAPGEVGDLADALHRLGEELALRLRSLEVEESRLSALIDSLNEGVIVISADQRVVRMSSSARSLLNLPQPTPFPVDLIPREAALRRAITDALHGQATGPREIVVGGRTLSLNALPQRAGGAVLAFFDLTPTKRLDTMRRDFVANVSHELRTPLTVIGGFAETLADDDLPRGKAAGFARTIVTHTHRMQRLVNDLLDLSRIESGGWSPKPEAVRLPELLAEITSGPRLAAEAKGVALVTRVSPDAEVVYADRTALSQIIVNLLENAVRHTAHGTVVISSAPLDGAIELSVSDTGSGIAAEHLHRIFERFYRADPGRSRESGGTGLGLSIVKHLAEAHGGTVSAESEPGKGTTIRVRLPQSSGYS